MSLEDYFIQILQLYTWLLNLILSSSFINFQFTLKSSVNALSDILASGTQSGTGREKSGVVR